MFLKYFKAAYPVLAVETFEEWRVAKTIHAEVTEYMSKKENKGRWANVYFIGVRGGLYDLNRNRIVDDSATYEQVWQMASSSSMIVIVADFRHLCVSPAHYRPLLNAIPGFKRCGSTIVLAGPVWKLPEELQHIAPVIEYPLPTREELKAALQVIVSNVNAKATGASQRLPDPLPNEQEILDAAAGLTMEEAENVIALALRPDGIDHHVVLTEKMRLVRQTTGLSILQPQPLEVLGGLSNFKKWLQEEVVPNKRDLDLAVRAMLFIGPPGTGKSLAARCLAKALEYPIIGLDLAACRGQYVGATESNVRRALQMADAVAPSILRLDEIDSALGGYASSAHTDGGVTLNVLSMLQTWLQDNKKPIVVVGTANYPDRIPPALMRAGRMDAIWVFDLPTTEERREIARIHLRRFVDNNQAEKFADVIANLTEGYTGAEIEGIVKTAARVTQRKLRHDVIMTAVDTVVPLSRSKAEEINNMRKWGEKFARFANEEAAGETKRRL